MQNLFLKGATMSALKEKLQNDMKNAMRNKENFKRDTIRLINSAIKQIEVDERKELNDEDVLNILKKAAKQREEAITQYKAGGRDDLVQKESDELDIIMSYLPKQLSDEELKNELLKIKDEVGAMSAKDMGKIMGVATKKLGSVADGKKNQYHCKRDFGLVPNLS